MVAGDYSVTVGIGIVSGADIEVGFTGDQTGHGERAAAVHSDFFIPVQGHKTKLEVHLWVHHG